MEEWKRIFRNRRILAGLFLILFLNGVLFLREQNVRDYGLDCSLPKTFITVSVEGGSYEVARGTVDSWKCYGRYLEWLERYKERPLGDVMDELSAKKEELTDILAISELLSSNNENSLEQYREENSNLVQQLEDGKLDLDEVKLDYIAVNNLLVQATYLDEYDDYLDTIQANKDKMLSFSIFNDPDSFSGRNIVKTAEEFEALRNVSLTLGANGAVTAFMDFSLSDYLMLGALVLICVCFLDERKKGLWNTVYAAPNGRLTLALKRTGILFSVSVTGVFLVYGSNLFLGFSIYGGAEDLERAVQSVELLGKMPVNCTIGQFLLRYFVFKIGAAFLVALLLWLIFTVINNVKYTLIAAAGVLAAEYSLYTFLPVQSGWNVFKYFNIFTYISLSDLYTNYLNINLFGYPVGIRAVSQMACLPLVILLAVVCSVIHCHKRPAAGKDLLGKIAYGFSRIKDSILRTLSLLGFELYKTLDIQKGILILLLFLYLVSGLSFTVTIPVEDMEGAYARYYTSELAGEITESTFERMEEIQAELDETLDACDEAKMQYESGEMEYPQYDVFAREAEDAQKRSEGLDRVRKRVEELQSLGKEKGFIPWLIEESPYQGTYGEASKGNQQKAALVAMLALLLLLAGSFSYEAQSGMKNLLASAKRGRNVLLHRKIAMAAILTTLIWAVTYALEVQEFLGICDTASFSASVQNLYMLEEFPFTCSIGGFLVGLYIFRWLALFACAMLTMLISSCMKRLETSYIAACGILILPGILWALG